MVAEFLAALLRANLVLGAAILLVALARVPARQWFGARIAYCLWLAVPIAGVASFLPAPVVEIPAAPPSTDMPTSAVHFAPAMAASPAANRPVAAKTLSAPVDTAAILLATWVLGLLVTAAIFARRQRRFIDAMGQLRRLPHANFTLFMSEGANTGPAVLGAFRPRIILPADFQAQFDTDEQMVVIAHERAHLSRGDAQVNGAVAMLQCLCWFNPFMHLGAHLHRRDQEMACDATVLAAHPDRRRVYAQALLKGQLARDLLPLGCHWPGRSAHPLKARIVALEAPRGKATFHGVGIATACMASVCAGYAAWAAQPPRYVVAQTIAQPAHYAIVRKETEQHGKSIERAPLPGLAGGNAAKMAVSPAVAVGAEPAEPMSGTDQEAAWIASDDDTKAAIQAEFIASYRLAKYRDEFKQVKAIAEAGDRRALLRLAGMYGSGSGVEQDSDRMLAIYREIAEAGDTTPYEDWTTSGQAMLKLAESYDRGTVPGVDRDMTLAADWYRRWARTVVPATPGAAYAMRLLERIDSPSYRAGAWTPPMLLFPPMAVPLK